MQKKRKRNEGDVIVKYWFDPSWCGIYSSRYRFCFETDKGRKFVADLDICLRKLPYHKAIQQHRMRFLQEAFRNAIKPQVEEAKRVYFLRIPVQVCPYSGELFSMETCHVDHGGFRKGVRTYTFSQLLTRFFRDEERYYDNNLNLVELTSSPPFEIIDPSLKKRWQGFHSLHATLHIVSRMANLYLCH